MHLVNGEGEVQFSSRHKEDVLRWHWLWWSKKNWWWQHYHRAEDEHPEFIHAFNAYTPPGDVTGELVFVPFSSHHHHHSNCDWQFSFWFWNWGWVVDSLKQMIIFSLYRHILITVSFLSYVNYGRVEDIQKLEELGISLEGRIAISR